MSNVFQSTDPFFNVPLTTRTCSLGDVDFPVRYDDTTSVVSLFQISTRAAAAEVAPHGMRPALVLGPRTLVALVGYNYRKTSIGPYFEVGLAIPVVPSDAPRKFRLFQALQSVDDPARDLGYWVLHLPVSTDIANIAGRETYGLPKFVTQMDVSSEPYGATVRVADPDNPGTIMELVGKPRLSLPAPALSLLLCSWLNDQLLRYPANARGRNQLHLPGSMKLSIGPSSHPMAQTMRRLGLDGKRPLAVMTTDKFASLLHLGVPIKARGNATLTQPAEVLVDR